jgi:hypothetical protein
MAMLAQKPDATFPKQDRTYWQQPDYLPCTSEITRTYTSNEGDTGVIDCPSADTSAQETRTRPHKLGRAGCSAL